MERRLAAIMAADVVGYSRLIRADEEGTLAAFQALRSDLIDPKIAAHKGRIVKALGDGLLVEFASVVDAVRGAVEVQQALAERNDRVPEDRRIVFRIGVNLGDVVIEGDDIHGDGVNVAARLEAICEPGGVCISDMVYQAIASKTELAFDDLGARELKNIETPIRVWQWRPDDQEPAGGEEVPVEQQINFCTAPDGCTIAYASIGHGPPVVRAPNWLSHLEYDWESPVWRHMLRDISRDHILIRFDQRGTGLSDWRVPEITFESMVSDLAMVADAAGLERFALYGISQGCPYSIAYAVRHPERVSHLVLYGGFAIGALASGIEHHMQRIELYQQVIRQGWGKDNPAFRQFFTSMFMPGATKDQMDWFNELQGKTTTGETAARIVEMSANADVTGLLAQIKVPTLVLHRRDDAIASFNAARRMSAGIPNARFVALEGQNHLILEDEPAWPQFMEEFNTFLAQDEV